MRPEPGRRILIEAGEIRVSEEPEWLAVCRSEDLGEDEVVRFDHGGVVYAVYRTQSGLYATDGICTHNHAYLADGLVMDDIIECPLHQGRFHIPTGKAKSSPACVDLRTYAAREADGNVLIGLSRA